MASWKKVIVSGSTAELAGLTLSGDLTVTGGDITLGSTSIFSGGDTTSLNNIDAIDATTEATIESAIDTLSNLTAASSLATVGTLNSGAISSGFGNIDNGTSTLNTGNATVDNFTNNSAVAASHITGSMTGSFTGDGSGLTGVTAAVDIDSLSAAGIAQTDLLIFSDAGTESKITFSDFEDTIFGAVSGDATIAAGGALTIANDSVDNNMLANITRGSIKVGGASDAPTDLDAKTSGQILVGDGTDIASVAVSGDVSLAANGAVTIAANAVEGSMLNSNVAGTGLDYGSNQLSVDVSDFMTNGANNRILTATGTDAQNAEANLTFDGSTLALTGALTVSTNATIDGDLTVSGTTTTLNTTNLLVDDRFILLNSGSATGDGGIVVQTESTASGSAFAYDDSEGRWGFQIGTKLGQNATTSAPDSYASAVVTSDDANYRKNGNIRVDSGEIYIYVE